MGSDKALLDWHGRALVVHVAEILGNAATGPVVVVAAPGQELPPLPGGVERAFDTVAEQGPLEGLRTGLEALEGRAELAVVWSVDAPNLRPELCRLLIGALGEADAAVPFVAGFTHPLSAVYRVSLLPLVARLLDSGERRARAVAEACTTVLLDEPTLRTADPDLRFLIDLDTPEELAAAVVRKS
jgi:molybdenum cofactor guanylyltransferase